MSVGTVDSEDVGMVPPSMAASFSAQAGELADDECELGADAAQAADADAERGAEHLRVALALAGELQRRIAHLAARPGADGRISLPLTPTGHPPAVPGLSADAKLDLALARFEAARERLAAHRAALGR